MLITAQTNSTSLFRNLELRQWINNQQRVNSIHKHILDHNPAHTPIVELEINLQINQDRCDIMNNHKFPIALILVGLP